MKFRFGPRKLAVVVSAPILVGVSYIAWRLGGTDGLLVVGFAFVLAALALLAAMVVGSDRRLRQQLASGIAKARGDQSALHTLVEAQTASALETLSSSASVLAHLQSELSEASRRLELPATHAEHLLRAVSAGYRRLELEQERSAVAMRKVVVSKLDRLEAVTGKLLLEGHAREFRQLEALLSLYIDTRAKVGFPATRSWVASPDFLLFLHGLVTDEEPELVVECGSGLSTVMIAYALRDVGTGTVVSLEHLEEFQESTVRMLERHGLQDWADVRLAPLAPVEIAEESWPWYARSALPESQVDLLVVDGPPGQTGPLARFPALPLLRERLGQAAPVILDDYGRDDEQQVVQRWLEMHEEFELTAIAHEKGTAVLRSR